MNEQIFWQLIDKARAANNSNFETQCVTLTELLVPYATEDIIAFEHLLREKIEEASSWPIMAATFVVCSFISDDTYEDFRAWLVAQGKDNFYKILKDPNEICKVLTPKEAQDLDGEYMLFVGANAWLEKLNKDNEDEFYELIDHPEEKVVDQQWPETKEAYRKLFPALYDMFWNEERIQERLSEAEEEE